MKKPLQNHERIKKAVSSRAGEILKTEQIRALCHQRFPDMADGSILPNDHAEGNKHPCWCAKQPMRLFDRVRYAHYRVRPAGAP
jgi:hypothetical protein